MRPPDTHQIQRGSFRSSRRARGLGNGRGLVEVFFFAVYLYPGFAQTVPWSVRTADTLIARAPHGSNQDVTRESKQETGLELEGLTAAWYNTANGDYFRFVRKTVDAYLDAHNSGADANPSLFAENDSLLAHQILLLYRVTLAPRYFNVASTMQHQLAAHCIDTSPDMSSPSAAEELPKAPCNAQPFLAEYASVFHQPQDFAAIARSLARWEERVIASPTSRPNSDTVRDRSLSAAWLAVALVDSLPSYPEDGPGRAELIALLNRLAAEAVQQQNGQTGLLEEASAVEAHASRPLSPSTSCLLLYAL